MEENEYEKAWAEGEEQGTDAAPAPAAKAVKAAREAEERNAEDEYLRAYAELDEAEKKADGKTEDEKEAQA